MEESVDGADSSSHGGALVAVTSVSANHDASTACVVDGSEVGSLAPPQPTSTPVSKQPTTSVCLTLINTDSLAASSRHDGATAPPISGGTGMSPASAPPSVLTRSQPGTCAEVVVTNRFGAVG